MHNSSPCTSQYNLTIKLGLDKLSGIKCNIYGTELPIIYVDKELLRGGFQYLWGYY